MKHRKVPATTGPWKRNRKKPSRRPAPEASKVTSVPSLVKTYNPGDLMKLMRQGRKKT